MRRLMFAAMVILGLSLPVAVSAQAGSLPEASEVIARYVEAIGGRDAILAVEGAHVWGRLEMPAQGITGQLEILSAAPNKILVLVSITGLGESKQGYDGEVGWSVDLAMGPMVLDSLMLDQLREQADFSSPLHPPEFVASMETLADTLFEDRPAYKVKVTTPWGEEYVEFFDKESALMIGAIRGQASPMGSLETTAILSDYRELAGILTPFKTTQRIMGMEQIITADSARSEAIPDSVFALPPEIKALRPGGGG